jgi:hypothetical protein
VIVNRSKLRWILAAVLVALVGYASQRKVNIAQIAAGLLIFALGFGPKRAAYFLESSSKEQNIGNKTGHDPF